MKVQPTLVLLLGVLAAIPVVSQEKTSVSYPAKPGPGQGRHIVLLAGDEEYRSEEGLPMLAKILSQRHGFKCTVLFSVDGGRHDRSEEYEVAVQSLGARYRRRCRHAAALPRLAGRRHGAVRQVAEGREADRRAADQHACLQRLPEGQPVGNLELQQRRAASESACSARRG